MFDKKLRVGLGLILMVALAGCGSCGEDPNNGGGPDAQVVDDADAAPAPDAGDIGAPDDTDVEPDVTDEPDTDSNPPDTDLPDTDLPDTSVPDADMGVPDVGDDFDPVAVCLDDCNYAGDRADEVDCDYDGISNTEEVTLGTDTCDNDTDGDGLSDLGEIQQGTDGDLPDSDGDGLNDADELFFGFDPLKPDTLEDGILDGDRWIVNACNNPQSEQVDYHVNSPGDWQIALPPAISNYTELTISTATPQSKLAAAVFDDTANEVTSFILSTTPAATDQFGVDILRRYVPPSGGPVRSVGVLEQSSNGGDFDTHDFHTAAIGRYLMRTPSAKSARQVRDQLLFAIAPFASQDVTGLPNSAGATYTQFRIFVSATLRKSAINGDRVITTVAVAPAEKYDSREKVQFRMDDLTNTTNVSSAADLNQTSCSQFRATEGTPAADFYWVLDQSGSMLDEFDDMKAIANQFFAELQNTPLDYRLGVVNMDDDSDGRVRSTAGWHTDQPTFLREIDEYVIACPGCDGGREFGLKVAKEGIEWMIGSSAPQNVRIRPEAQIITVFMSDEEAQTFQNTDLNSAAGQTLMNDFKTFFQAHTIAFAIVDAKSSSGCSPEGEAYKQIALATGGTYASLCDNDLSETIESIIIAATGAASNYRVAHTPISSTLRVFKNGEWVPRSRINGFDYFAERNSIAFFGTYRPEPTDPNIPGHYGDDVAISYQTFIDTTKD